MRINKGKIFIITVAGVLVLFVVIWQLTKIVTSASPLSADEASKLVKERYNGNVVQINKLENKYKVTFELETGTYVVEVNRKTGDVDSLTRTSQNNLPENTMKTEAEIRGLVKQQQNGDITNIEKKVEDDGTYYYASIQQGSEETTYKIDAFNGKIMESTTQKGKQPTTTNKILTKEKAAQIALKNVSGKVDDIEFEQSNGVTYFLVEVDRENDKDATVQINAISGEIMSITWDD
ncbi:PepSY domain-containing protein [Lederbergia wuyishanensis]|uniref:Membrane protein YkoI n=1 Tax=Lederbergia wuyishanensis TaxID=1347903 RepID=A0ABU0D4B5_9BACI|nr:PepSY domain-containing protein [Lederbergia wuyishanensis]MCJ8008176.1 PepSY domain-containing protein [Lederbergia wuyishanensis]MDQ0343235.1 putative membrane protein YkoI [Lederbergia wuyishanensis]